MRATAIVLAIWLQGLTCACGQVIPERIVDQLRGCIWSSDGCRTFWQIQSNVRNGYTAVVDADSVGVVTFDLLMEPSILQNGDGYLDTVMGLMFSYQLERYRSPFIEVSDQARDMVQIFCIDETGLIVCKSDSGQGKCQLSVCVDTTNAYLINSDIEAIRNSRSLTHKRFNKLLSYMRSSIPKTEPRIHGCYFFIEERRGGRKSFQSVPYSRQKSKRLHRIFR